MQSLALAWLARTLNGRAGGAAAQQLTELQALLQKGQTGEGTLQMPSDLVPMAQRPTDEVRVRVKV